MKSITYPSIIAIGVCLALASVALAQEAENETTPAEVTDELGTTTPAEPVVTTSPSADSATQIDDRRAELDDRTKQRITNLAANISNRMDAATARMQNIIIRLESRINKLTAAGLDTSEAVAALASAQVSINAAASALQTIDVSVQAAVTSEDPRAAWQTVKRTYGDIRAQLQTAYTEIQTAIQALKAAARAGETQTSTSTSEETAPPITSEVTTQ